MTVLETNTDGANVLGNPFCNVIDFIEAASPFGKSARDLVHEDGSGKTSAYDVSTLKIKDDHSG